MDAEKQPSKTKKRKHPAESMLIKEGSKFFWQYYSVHAGKAGRSIVSVQEQTAAASYITSL